VAVVRVAIPEVDWTALKEFVMSRHPLPHGIEASVSDAETQGVIRFVAFR
jgi:hypothetical protein